MIWPFRRRHSRAYNDYMNSQEWHEKRRQILMGAGHQCQMCGATGVPLQVHHRTYERLGHEWVADCIALCRGCHRLADKQRRKQHR